VFKRVENLLPELDFNQIADTVNSFKFDWHYLPGTVPPDHKQFILDSNDFQVFDSEQFVHVFVGDNEEYSSYVKIIEIILTAWENVMGKKILELGRIKANMLMRKPGKEKYFNCPHTDRPDPGWTSMVYYINNSDGDTVLFDKAGTESCKDMKIIDSNPPKKNHAVIFDSDRYHTSTNPVDNSNRIVLNFIAKFEK